MQCCASGIARCERVRGLLAGSGARHAGRRVWAQATATPAVRDWPCRRPDYAVLCRGSCTGAGNWRWRTPLPPLPSLAVAVIAGADHAKVPGKCIGPTVHECGLRADGSVACYGYDFFEQTNVPPGLFTSLSAGHSHNCAIKEADGSLTCWGWNDAGQATAPAGTFVVVALGWRHSCGLRESGEIECWGEIEPRCPAASSRPWRPVRMAADAASSGPRRGPLTTPASRAASSSAGGITCPGRMARRTRCSLRSRSASSTPAESGPTARSRVGAAILTAKPLYPTASLSPSASETSTAAA